MARQHGSGTRGLDLSAKSPLFEGRFGRIFRALPPAEFGANEDENVANLTALAEAMVADPDPVKDGQDAEESGIPSAFTYLGQFIDHDLTFDPASSLTRQNDPDALTDFRTPAFDLDNVYGRGPDDQPYLYEKDSQGRTLFLLGTNLTGDAAGNPIASAHDLPRLSNNRAVIGDPRNDENVIVSQLQGLFHRFHNRVATDTSLPFEETQRLVRFHYQWVVMNDFLPKVVAHRVLHRVLPGSDVSEHPPVLRFYHAKQTAFMPLEFSAAAYRMGHSMVRPGYRLNDAVLQPIFPFSGSGGKDAEGNPIDIAGPGLTGFGKFPGSWAIDWARLIDIGGRKDDESSDQVKQRRVQLAYRIDASLVDPLGGLPMTVAGGPPISLAARNLIRGWRMRLPSGQAIARAMGIPPLSDDDLILGKEEVGATIGGRARVSEIKPDGAPKSVFPGNCPLWTYVLAEAAQEYRKHKTELSFHVEGGMRKVGTPQLGDVGGTIVAETFAGIMLEDQGSYFNLFPKFKPTHGISKSGRFGLRDFINYALGNAPLA